MVYLIANKRTLYHTLQRTYEDYFVVPKDRKMHSVGKIVDFPLRIGTLILPTGTFLSNIIHSYTLTLSLSFTRREFYSHTFFIEKINPKI